MSAVEGCPRSWHSDNPHRALADAGAPQKEGAMSRFISQGCLRKRRYESAAEAEAVRRLLCASNGE
jgi:hypothetical protein